MDIHSRVKTMAEGNVWKLFGVNVLKGTDGECELEIEMKEEFKQSYGSMHGGVIATALDMSMAAAISTTLEDNKYCNTIDLYTSYLRPMAGSRLIAKAAIVKNGKRVAVLNADAFNEEGKHIATARGTFMILDK
ncbi:PaaI family thioesterase [Domibacillus tundrae]|uniref:PaaI family thioesterase n=1 Tax=Domibacillus tundrae TaxID=1587527 RepID=UPI000698D9CF|nr:PaaI family thioesterase [Domibacillus tundrae]